MAYSCLALSYLMNLIYGLQKMILTRDNISIQLQRVQRNSNSYICASKQEVKELRLLLKVYALSSLGRQGLRVFLNVAILRC